MVVMTPRKPKDAKYELIRIVGQCAYIPIYLALYPVAFYVIGAWLDGKLGTAWIKVVFVFLGIASAFRQTYFLIKKLSEEQDRDGGA